MASKIDSLESKPQPVGETNYDTYTSTFQCLIQHEQNNNMLYLCNELYDMFFNFKNITKTDTDELKHLLSGYCNDELFNEFIIKFFSNGLNAYSFKSNIQTISSFPSISVQSALNVLNDVFKSAHSEQIKRYILFLTVPIENIFNQSSEKFSELNIYNGAFYQYIVEYIKKYISKKLVANQLDKHSMFCLVSFICQNDDSTEALPAKLKYINIDMEYSKCDSFNDIWEQLLNNYDALHANKTTGFNLNGSFENSVKLFSYITPIWDNLSATFTLRNNPLPNISTSIRGGSTSVVHDSDLIKIYAGDYSLVPENQELAKSVNIDVVSNFNTFNQLSNKRKLQVSNFLLNNRKRFNTVLSEAAQIIVNGLKSNLEDATIKAAVNNTSIPTHARNIGFNLNSRITEDIVKFAQKLKTVFDSQNIKTFDNAINFIVHSYIPLLNQFENKCMHKYGISESKSVLSKYAMNNVLKIIGVSTLIDTDVNSSRINSSNKLKSVGGWNVNTTTPMRANTTTPTVIESQHVDDVEQNSSRMQGGESTTEKLISALINGQIKFNKGYEEIYRRLISELNSVNITNVHDHTYVKLYSVINQFESIAIRSNKTTSYISGYYGAKNYNRLYTKCVDNTIKAIIEANVPIFNDVVKVLTELKELLENSAKEVQELRNKFISAPKSVSEMLIVASKAIKQPCGLTQTDFNLLAEAIGRLSNTVRSYSTESNVYNTKQQIENYLTKVRDRTKIINDHYNNITMMTKTELIAITHTNTNNDMSYATETMLALIEQRRACALYLNEVLDSKLANERIANLKKASLTREQIDSIEKAFVVFKNTQITPEFKHDMEKLSRLLENPSIGYVFKIIKALKKLIYKSQYLNFFSQLCRELHIFDDNFNWTEFNNKITTMLILSSIRIQRLYDVNNRVYTLDGLIHHASEIFEKYWLGHKQLNNAYPAQLKNSAYIFMYDLLSMKLYDDIASSTSLLPIQITKISDVFTSFMELAEPYGFAVATTEQAAFNRLFADDVPDVNDFVYQRAALYTDHYEDNIFKKKADKRSLQAACVTKMNNVAGTVNLLRRNRLIGTIIYYVKNILNIFVENESFKPLTPYTIKHTPIYFGVLHDGLVDGEGSLMQLYNENIKPLPSFGVSVFGREKSEYMLSLYAVESICANILAMIDKYWAVKYNGIMSLPLNISGILRGGDIEKDDKINQQNDVVIKQEGGTIFDSMPLHDQSNSSVIPEAVPFYICAFNICQYYIDSFGSNITVDRPTLMLHINKISILYPIYEIFNKYQAKINTLTPAQLKTSLAVFNEIWNQTEGNEASRLSRSIDIIFNELNACFIFTDKVQLELIKSTNSLSKASIDIINENISAIVEQMKHTLNSSVLEFNEEPEAQAKRLEYILNNAYNKVKQDPEHHRLATLKSLLMNDDKDGSLKDFYKFMELVIAPMLISAKSYIHIFSLFENYSFDAENAGDENVIDFTQYNILFKEYNTDDIEPMPVAPRDAADRQEHIRYCHETLATAWELITAVRTNERPELKAIFIENPLVLKYNKLLLNEALDTLHKTGTFTLPKFWIVMDEHTYPSKPTISFTIDARYYKNDNIVLMRQLWSNVHANTVADYYNHCVTEFISDYDHFIHNFVSYPGLSDKSIKIISDTAHDAIKLGNVNNQGDVNDRFVVMQVYSIKNADTNLLNSAKNLTKIKVQKSKTYLYPPSYAESTIIPRFNDAMTPAEELEIVSESTTNDKNNVHIDGTGVYVKSASATTDNITGCEYTWLDWVIYQIAKCDKTNFCVPYKFIQIIQDYPGLNAYIRQPGYDKKNNKMQYNRATDGTYNNIVTQNIIMRSISTANKDKSDYASLNNSWIAALVATIPYIISTLEAYKASMEQNILYNRNSVSQCMNYLIDSLTMFYDDIGNYTPFIPFMTDSVQVTANTVKPHIFAELLSFINKCNLCNIDSSDLIKIEWANMWFFNELNNITFPEYKNRNRFEWIYKFASDKLDNGTFRNEFDTTIQTLGRNVWAGLIAKTSNYYFNFKNVYRELDEIIIRVINIMSECDTDIIQHYINNIIDEYSINMRTTSNQRMTGGSSVNVKEPYSIPEYMKETAKRLTKGLINNTVVETKSNVTVSPVSKINSILLWNDELPRQINETISNYMNNSNTTNVYDLSLKSIFDNPVYNNIINSINSIKHVYSDTILNKDLKYKDIYSNILGRIELHERALINEINEVVRAFDKGIVSDKLLSFMQHWLNHGVLNAPVDAANVKRLNNFNNSILTVIESMKEENSQQMVLTVDGVNIYLYKIIGLACMPKYSDGRHILNGIFRRNNNLISYIERILAYFGIISVGLMYGLYKFLHNVKNTLDEYCGAEYIANAGIRNNVKSIHTSIYNYMRNIVKYYSDQVCVLMSLNYDGTIVGDADMIRNTFGDGYFKDRLCSAAGALFTLDAGSFTNVNENDISIYIDNTKIILKEYMKIFSIPVFTGKCKDILRKLPFYDFINRNGRLPDPVNDVNPGLTYGNTAENNRSLLAIAYFDIDMLKSISNVLLNTINNIDGDLTYADEGANENARRKSRYQHRTALLQNIDQLNTAITDCNNDTQLVDIYTRIISIRTSIYNKSLFNQRVVDASGYIDDINGRLTLKGGFYSVDKIELIYAIAAGITNSIKNRALYIDEKQSIKSAALIIGSDGVLANEKAYLYKFLYNPNLCSLMNKTKYNNIEYVLANIAANELFIIDPTYELNNNEYIDLNKITFKLSTEYEKLYNIVRDEAVYIDGDANIVNQCFNNIEAIADDYNHQENIEYALHNIHTSTNLALDGLQLRRFKNYVKRVYFANTHRFIENGELVVVRDLKSNNKNIRREEIGDLRMPRGGGGVINGICVEDVPNPELQLIPNRLNVSYENTKTTITPKIHKVEISDKMFMYVPYCKAVEQHLFSPQKDIYNATLINMEQPASPTILENPSRFYSFTKHTLKLSKLTDYVTVYGGVPTYSKDLTNYTNLTHNPIYTFIELLLKKNIDSLFDPKESLKFNNFGFDVGTNVSLNGRGLLGGFEITDNISNRFVNIDNISLSSNELELLGSAYNIDDVNDVRTLADGKRLYSYIFKSNFANSTAIGDNKAMFTLILNYFHKYNLSFTSMFDRICFPSILFNTAAFRLAITRVNKLISDFNTSHDELNESYKGQIFSVVESFLSSFEVDGESPLTLNDDYRYQVNFIERLPQLSIKDVITKLRANDDAPNFEKNKVLWLTNQYTKPSVANNFFMELVKNTTIHDVTNTNDERFSAIQMLFPSNILGYIRNLDSISSFISILFMLLKQTSYYDHDYERDVTFFNVQNPEPFSVV